MGPTIRESTFIRAPSLQLVGVHHQRQRAVVQAVHLHVGAELAGLGVEALGAAELHELLVQGYYQEGDKLTVGSLTLDVLETPGHSQGSVCLLVEGQNVIFAGDTLFRCSCGRCDFPGGDYRAMLRSLARLGRLEGQYTVYPGHDSATDMDYERKYNPYMKQGMNA